MLTYTLCGQTVSFPDSAEHWYDLQIQLSHAQLDSVQKFGAWYKQCGNIKSVLDGYTSFVQSSLTTLAVRPLFDQLADCDIYDMSEDTYWKQCVNLSHVKKSLNTIRGQYQEILDAEQQKREYREERKAERSRWEGGGFGFSGAIKGAAEAAALNAVSGLGHSLVNAVGNAGSALSASLDKNSLYSNASTSDTLLSGITLSVSDVFSNHIQLINAHHPGYIRSVFDGDRAAALFENAKKLPDKRNSLLVQAFSLCPWNEDLVRYIFLNCPDGREDIRSAAKRFCIDLAETMEQVIAGEYDESAQASESAALEAKKRILDHMQTWNLTYSPTLDRLETDCLWRLCEGCQLKDEDGCDALIEEIRSYQAQDKLKKPFYELVQKRKNEIWTQELEQICQDRETADEAACVEMLAAIQNHRAPAALKTSFTENVRTRIRNILTGELEEICRGCKTADNAACEQMLVAIDSHHAPDELKTQFRNRVRARMEDIWNAEERALFDDLYMETDITNEAEVARAISYIRSRKSSAFSKTYLDILNACSPKNIAKARLYQNTNRYRIFMTVGTVLFLIMCIMFWNFESVFDSSDTVSVIAVLLFPVSLVLLLKATRMKKAWNRMTHCGTIIHPMLLC